MREYVAYALCSNLQSINVELLQLVYADVETFKQVQVMIFYFLKPSQTL